MIVIAGHAEVDAASIDELLATASAMAATSRAEEGCVDYRFSIDIDEPRTVRLFECWESAEALDAHFATAHYAAFAEAIGGAVIGSADFTRFEVGAAGPLFG